MGSLPQILWTSCISWGRIVTLFMWMAQRLVSSNKPMRCASVASCRAPIMIPWNHMSDHNPWAISQTSLWKGSLWLRSLVILWYLWISLSATVPGLNWCGCKVQNKVLNNNQEDTSNNNNTNNNNTSGDSNETTNNNNQPISTTNNRATNKAKIGQIVIPYMKGTSESVKHICSKYGIQVHFKGKTTIKQILMKPKDRDPKERKSGLLYSYQCPQLDCDDEYIGETARTLGERRKEHLKQPPPLHRHSQTTGHPIDNNKLNIIGREDWGQARTIKESIYIRVNNPTLNQNIGKYNLNHIWNRVLVNTPGPKQGSSHHPAVIQ